MRDGRDFEVRDYADELEGEPNHEIATSVLFENARVRIWDLTLAPGERVPFHWHVHPNMWVVIEGGTMRSMHPDGTAQENEFVPGLTCYDEPVIDDPNVHSVMNVGTSTIRIRNIELVGIEVSADDRTRPIYLGLDAGRRTR